VCLVLCIASSCDKLDDLSNYKSGFKLKFSDGLQINQSDVQFYDSSTNMLFLKGNLEIGNAVIGYDVMIADETIYDGIIYSCFLSSPPKETFFISDCFLDGRSVIELEYYPHGPDMRNDSRIINSFKKSGQLLNGISCEIDDINVINHESSSEVSCKITITNHDPIRYYIIDPYKMGNLNFSYFTGGIFFRNQENRTSSFLRWSEQSPNYAENNLNDLSVISGYSQRSFTFSSSDYYKMEEGNYTASFSFCGINTIPYPSLDRKMGRVWVGRCTGEKEVVVGGR